MTSTSFAPAIPIIDSVAALAADKEAWICDIWGVVHNGLAAFAPAVAACRRFRASGGTVLLLTNAPRPASAVGLQLDKLAVARDAYDAVLTSGDLTRGLIAEHRAKPMLHIGPDRDRGLFDGVAVKLVGSEAAEVVICSGLHDDDRETAEDYRERLLPLARRGAPMVCANPDLTVARGSRIIACAGAVAKLYEDIGGQVIYAGKPHLPVYDRAFAMIAEARGREVDKGRILAIGDGVHTDIRGAANAGISALFVASPVHLAGALTDESLARTFRSATGAPVAAMTGLVW